MKYLWPAEQKGIATPGACCNTGQYIDRDAVLSMLAYQLAKTASKQLKRRTPVFILPNIITSW